MIDLLRKLDGILDDAKGIATMVGLGGLVKITDTILTISTDLLENVATGKTALTSSDVAEVEALLAKVQAENDELIKLINRS